MLELGRDVLFLSLCQPEWESEALDRKLDAFDGEDVVAAYIFGLLFRSSGGY
jgi:hypothetical protein